MASKTLDQLNNDIFKALTDNSSQLGVWLSNAGDANPHQALQSFDKIANTYMKLKEFQENDLGDIGFEVIIEAPDAESAEVLHRLTDNDAQALNDILKELDEDED